jgi:hypothetical protein
MHSEKLPFGLTRQALVCCAPFILFSSVAFLLGVVWDPQRIWANLLVVSYYLFGLGLGGALFLALLSLTGARWSTLIQPILIRLTALVPAGAAGIALVVFARPSLYPWTETDPSGSTFQAFWLSRPLFLFRTLLYLFGLWVMTSMLVHTMRREEIDNKKGKVSAAFLVVYALICWLASTDWIMSLEPKWSSTAFGVYNFSGMFLGTLAAVVVLVTFFARLGILGGNLTKEQWRDLGTLLFAFSSFWMYIWFSQYMLIWYVNNPEEAEYFVLRQQGPWQGLFLTNLVLNWGVPFVVLLFRRAKENWVVMLLVAVTVLVGRFLDLYLMVLPPVARDQTVFGFWDACLIPGAVALAVLISCRTVCFHQGKPEVRSIPS